MQTEIALSTIEAEYIVLSQNMIDIIAILELIRELRDVYYLSKDKPLINYTLFENNNKALQLAKEPKYRPRSKHIVLKYHNVTQRLIVNYNCLKGL